ncbi:MAG: proline dehydrogenase family protein [Gemmatimonadota bacterium]|nr:proline dehydrogenase family protein [Gemmatimonadota bacterium]MDH4348577.1 proline dehydrogenase family protein [Gemmatimonadota bacterium]MDH5284362.1 proline dehydrogenase family protein [Gemmatimonadota bacterium]
MMRTGLLWLSEQQQVFRFVRRNPLVRKFAARFVAGETVETAVLAARELNARRITATLDLLGESIGQASEAAQARDTYLQMLDAIARDRVDSNVSLKLTQMGFDIAEDACFANMSAILDRAKAGGNFVRVDMEGSAYTQRTLDFFYQRLFPVYGPHVGVVIQSCLRRSGADVDTLIDRQVRVRLCKGAYLEPPDVAFPDKADVDRNYLSLMERLMERGNYPGIATHDEKIITHARRFAAQKKIDPAGFEFQMLYGVRRDLQDRLRADGFNVRVYIPFGTQWYPYLMRRLAERPANIAFIIGNVIREAVSPRR